MELLDFSLIQPNINAQLLAYNRKKPLNYLWTVEMRRLFLTLVFIIRCGKVKNSADYQYYSFDPDNSILYHEVNNDNFGDKESFIISLSYLVTLIDRFKPERIMIKVFKKPSYFELTLKNFMQKTLTTTLLNVGTKKIAFYVFEEAYIAELRKHEMNDPFMVKFFLDVELAKQWLIS